MPIMALACITSGDSVCDRASHVSLNVMAYIISSRRWPVLPCHEMRHYRCAVVDSPANLEVTAVYVQRDEQAGWVRTSDDTAVPTLFTAQLFIDDPAVQLNLFVQVDAAGRALVRRFEIVASDLETAVTTTMLRRFPVDALLREVLDRAAIKARPRSDFHRKAFQVEGDPEHQAWVSQGLQPVARKSTEDRVERAAEIYLQALASGSRAPAEVVAATLGYSRATAARDIRAARNRKPPLLPPLAQEKSVTADAITGTGRISKMPWSDFAAAREQIEVELGMRKPATDKPGSSSE